MVRRAVRVKKVSGGMASKTVEKGQSLSERLRHLEASTNKNASCIHRIESQVAAMMDAIQNLAQNLTGVDEKIDLHPNHEKIDLTGAGGDSGPNHEKRPSLHQNAADTPEERDRHAAEALAYAIDVQKKIETPEHAIERLAAEASDKHLKWKNMWHKSYSIVMRSIRVRRAEKSSLGHQAMKGESVAEKLAWLERFVLRQEVKDRGRISELELSLTNLAINIQGFHSKLANNNDEEFAHQLGKETESEAAVAKSKAMAAEAERIRAQPLLLSQRARRRWKRAIRLTVIGQKFQAERGVLTTGSVSGKSVFERIKQLERDLSKLLVQQAAPALSVVDFVDSGPDAALHNSPSGYRPQSPDTVPNRTQKALTAFYDTMEGPTVHDLASKETREALVQHFEVKSKQDRLTGEIPSLFEVANMSKLQCKILSDQIEGLKAQMVEMKAVPPVVVMKYDPPAVVKKTEPELKQEPKPVQAAPAVIEGEFATFEEMTSELLKRDDEIKRLLSTKADKGEMLDLVAGKVDSHQINPIRSKLGDLEDRFLAYTQDQESSMGTLVADLIEAYLAQLNLPSSDSVPNKQEVDAALAKLATMMNELCDSKITQDAKVQMLESGKANKEYVDGKADLSMLEAIRDFFKARMDELSKLASEGVTPQDLEKLRKALEEDFRKKLADLMLKKEEDDAVATVRCLTCGQSTDEQNPVVGAYAANKSKLRPHRLGQPSLSAPALNNDVLPDIDSNPVVGGGFHISANHTHQQQQRPASSPMVGRGGGSGLVVVAGSRARGSWGGAGAVPQFRKSGPQLGRRSSGGGSGGSAASRPGKGANTGNNAIALNSDIQQWANTADKANFGIM